MGPPHGLASLPDQEKSDEAYTASAYALPPGMRYRQQVLETHTHRKFKS